MTCAMTKQTDRCRCTVSVYIDRALTEPTMSDGGTCIFCGKHRCTMGDGSQREGTFRYELDGGPRWTGNRKQRRAQAARSNRGKR